MACGRIDTAILSNFKSPVVAVPKPNEQSGDEACRAYSLSQFTQLAERGKEM